MQVLEFFFVVVVFRLTTGLKNEIFIAEHILLLTERLRA